MSGRIEPALWQAAFDSFLLKPEKWDWLVPWAQSAQCLPLYCDWTHVFGLNLAGEIIAYEHEPWPGKAAEIPNGVVNDLRWLNVALHQGRKRHPWISALLPLRPNDAQDCSTCGGTGELPEPLVCCCGGSGWVPAADCALLR